MISFGITLGSTADGNPAHCVLTGHNISGILQITAGSATRITMISEHCRTHCVCATLIRTQLPKPALKGTCRVCAFECVVVVVIVIATCNGHFLTELLQSCGLVVRQCLRGTLCGGVVEASSSWWLASVVRCAFVARGSSWELPLH